MTDWDYFLWNLQVSLLEHDDPMHDVTWDESQLLNSQVQHLTASAVATKLTVTAANSTDITIFAMAANCKFQDRQQTSNFTSTIRTIRML